MSVAHWNIALEGCEVLSTHMSMLTICCHCALYLSLLQTLASVSTIGTSPDLSDQQLIDKVKSELSEWFGASEVDTWSHLRTYRIPFAQPNQSPPTNFKRAVSLGGGLYVCGDHRYVCTHSFCGSMQIICSRLFHRKCGSYCASLGALHAQTVQDQLGVSMLVMCRICCCSYLGNNGFLKYMLGVNNLVTDKAVMVCVFPHLHAGIVPPLMLLCAVAGERLKHCCSSREQVQLTAAAVRWLLEHQAGTEIIQQCSSRGSHWYDENECMLH